MKTQKVPKTTNIFITELVDPTNLTVLYRFLENY